MNTPTNKYPGWSASCFTTRVCSYYLSHKHLIKTCKNGNEILFVSVFLK